MTYQTSYSFDGSAALKADHRPNFTVIEGGKCKGVRMTQMETDRREHLFVALFAILSVVAVMGLSLGVDLVRERTTAQALGSAPTATVRVVSGDTLWNIAEEHPVRGVSTQEVANWIEQENGLKSPSLVPGQSLIVPVLG